MSCGAGVQEGHLQEEAGEKEGVKKIRNHLQYQVKKSLKPVTQTKNMILKEEARFVGPARPPIRVSPCTCVRGARWRGTAGTSARRRTGRCTGRGVRGSRKRGWRRKRARRTR